MNHHTNTNSTIAMGMSGTPSQYRISVRAIGKNQLMAETLRPSPRVVNRLVTLSESVTKEQE